MLFSPRSIAVIGSVRGGKVAHQIVTQLTEGGYRGKLWTVNPRAKGPEDIAGISAVAAVETIGERVDLAIICSPANTVAEVLTQCGRKRIPVAVIITSGFSETGHRAEEVVLRQIAEEYGIRVIGPNCAGIMNPHARLFASIEVRALPGRVAFITQSGAVGGAVLAMAETRGIGFSKFVSYGNRADIGEQELLEYLAHDKETDVVAVYLESVPEGRKFMEAARTVSREKPLLIIKAGRNAAGSRAAGSHTGALAGSDAVFNVMVRETGAIRVRGVEEMLDICQAFALLPPINGARLAIVTNSGGPGILTADRAEELDLQVDIPSEWVRQQLRTFLPDHCSFNNPVDLTVEGTEDAYRRTLENLLSADFDCAVAINVGTPFLDSEGLARGIVSAARSTGKAVAAVFMAGRIVEEGTRTLTLGKVPCFPTGERAVEALAAVARFTRQENRAGINISIPSVPDSVDGKSLAAPVLLNEAFDLMRDYGFSLPPYQSCESLQAFEIEKNNLQYPLVMKVISPTIVHKSDVGGVVLNLQTPAEVKHAFLKMRDRLRESDFKGVLLHEMIPCGVEIILGVKRDPAFGPVIMAGAGGIYAELMRDITLRIAPVDHSTVMQMLQELNIYPLLDGYRNSKPLAIESLAKQIELLSQLSIDHPEIEECDINPVFVLEGKAVVGDVFIRVCQVENR